MPEDGKPHGGGLEWAEEVVPVPPRKAEAGTRTCCTRSGWGSSMFTSTPIGQDARRRGDQQVVGRCFAYGVCLKVWSSTQNVVARSSGEAELYAAVRGAAEGMGLRSMVGDLGLEMTLRVHTDSDACRGTCNRTGLGRLKHLQVEHLWIQDAVRNRRFDLVRINGTENPADLMTKVLGRQRIDELLARLGFKDF